MSRGELYLVPKPSQADKRLGLESQVDIGVEEGLKHESSIHCDELMSLPKRVLTTYVGRLSPGKMQELDTALAVALDLAR